MFHKLGSLENITKIDPQAWNVRKADGTFDNQKFAFDKENYVYFRARIMTGNVPNGNGDFFHWTHNWGGIKEAYLTMVGKPLDKDHDCDSVDKIKGKIVDVITIETEKESYLEGLIAADKRIDPDFCRKIEEGEISSVSMSCLVEKARCSLCGNVAHNPDELCTHMRPGIGVKGKRVEATKENAFGIIYEENFGINFTGLGAVTVPADPTARIFEVWASMNDSKKLECLTNTQYENILNYLNSVTTTIKLALDSRQKLCQAGLEATDIKKKEEEKIVEKKVEKKKTDDNESESKIVKITEKKDEVSKEPIIIGDGFSLLPSKFENLLELQDRGQVTGIFVEQILEDIGEAEKVFRYQEKLGLIKPEVKKEVSRMKLDLSYIPGPKLEASFFAGREGEVEYKIAVSDIAPLAVQNAILNSDQNVVTPDEILEQIKAKCTDLLSFKRYMRKKRRDVMKEKAELEAKKVKKDDDDKKKKECDDEKEKKKKAAMTAFRTKMAMRRKSQQIPEGFAMNPKEVEKPAKAPASEELTKAINEKEADKDKVKLPSMSPSPVKKYFNRLPGDAPSAVERALKPGEASLISDLQKKVAEQEKVIAEKEQALQQEKMKIEQQEKGKLIYDIMSTLKKRDMVAAEKEDEVISYLGDFDSLKLKDFAKVLNITASESQDNEDVEADGNLAHVVETIAENEDAVEKLSKIMNMK